MGLEAKDIQVCMWRVVKFSMKFLYSSVKKYPIPFGILLFFFLLNRFLPSVFTFLIYSSPVLIFTAIFLRTYLRNESEKIKRIKGDTKKNTEKSSQKEGKIIVDKKNENSCVESQTRSRRNAKEKTKEVDQLHCNVEEKDMVFSTNCNDDLVDKNPLIEETLKEIREVKVDSVMDRPECSLAASKRPRPENYDGFEEKSKKFNGGEGETDESSEDEDDVEEGKEDGKKAVQWTENDQKNLMDLGISELERNRRLESLIAKRRARKLLSMQVRRTLMNMGNNDPFSQIATILIPRTNPFLPNNSAPAQVSPTPGSAPSVLLPMHNPFDLPYEPQEEKPNLTEDTFQQEFMPAHQKEMLYTRHESFSFGPFFQRELKQDRNEAFFPDFSAKRRIPEIPEYSRFKYKSGREDTRKGIEIGSSSRENAKQGQAHPEEDKSEVQTKPILEKYDNGGSSSSSSSEVNESNKDVIRKSLKLSIPKDIAADREDNGRTNEPLYDLSPCGFERTRMEERFFYPDKRVHHTPTHSIASDLQVEVSEVSSPSLTVDGTISNSDVESPIYDADEDIERETTSGSEETHWFASSHLSSVEENECRSREVNEISEQDIIEVGFSRIKHKSPDPTQSDTSSISSSMTEVPESSIVHEKDSNPKVYDQVQPNKVSSASNALSPECFTFPVPEMAQHCADKSVAYPSHNNDSEKPEEQSYLPETSSREVNDPIVCSDDLNVFEAIKDIDSEDPIYTKEESENLLVPPKEDYSKAIEVIERESENPENDRSKSTEDSEGQSENESEHKYIVEEAESIEDENIQDREDEQEVVEVGCSSADQNSDDPTVALDVVGQEVVIEQGPTYSSCSSPESVVQEKVRVNQFVLSDLDQGGELNVQQVGADMVDDKVLEELSQENINLTMSQNAGQSREDSTACDPSDGIDIDKVQEVSKCPGASAADSKINCNVDNPEVSLNNETEKLKTIKDLDDSDMSTPSKDTKSTHIVDIEGQSEEPGKDIQSNPAEEINSLNSFEDFGGDLTEISESIQDRLHEQSIEEVEFSGVSQELVVEQVPNASSSSSSPTSVLQKKFSIDQVSSLNSDQEIHRDTQQSEIDMVENNSLDGPPREYVISVTQNVPSLMEDSGAYPSISRECEDFQDSSDHSGKSTEEAKDTCNEEALEPYHPYPGRLIVEANVISNENESVNSRFAEQGNFKAVTETEAIVQLSKPAEEDGDPNIPKTSEGREEISNPLPAIPIEEDKIILNVNELEARDSEEESERLMRPENVVESSVLTSESVEESEGKSKIVTEVEDMVKHKINENRDTEELRELVDHENVTAIIDQTNLEEGNASFTNQ